MRRALSIARGPEAPRRAGGRGDLRPDGVELATGRNERELTGDPTAHAEILALRRAARRRAGWRLEGCALVVTVEPCTMCAGRSCSRASRPSSSVRGSPRPGAVGSLWDVVRDSRLNHRPEVYAGVLEPECAAVLRDFFAHAPRCDVGQATFAGARRSTATARAPRSTVPVASPPGPA
jgi:tRNA(adenine34) deaminase